MSGLDFYSLQLCVVLEAPFLMPGTEHPRYDLDVIQMRDQAGHPLIPEAQIRGMMRHAWRYLCQTGKTLPCSETVAFGDEGGDNEEVGLLQFSDLAAPSALSYFATTRVAIDDATGSAAEGQIVTVEQVAPPGDMVAFTGTVFFWAEDHTRAEEMRRGLQLALACIEAIGRFKTVGYGTVVHEASSVERPKRVAENGKGSFTPRARHELNFLVSKRLMVDTYHVDANTARGQLTIPGAALKGALATKLWMQGHDPRNGTLAQVLSTLRISHAKPRLEQFPLDRVSRLDLVQVKDEALSKWAGDCSAINFVDETTVPRFMPDFKFQNRPEPLYSLDIRTRSAVDAETGAAKGGALFTQEAISPTRGGVPLLWTAIIDFSDTGGDADSEACARLCFGALDEGIWTLGRTNAHTITRHFASIPAPEPKAADIMHVVIESPTLMIRERHLASDDLYQAALSEYWRSVTQGAFEIKMDEEDAPEIYCFHDFRGGFASRRYKFYDSNGQDLIEPFVLCRPGSVFILRSAGTGQDAEAIKALMLKGLPAARWDDAEGLGAVKTDNNIAFDTCPYTPENGYGAFSVIEQAEAAA